MSLPNDLRSLADLLERVPSAPEPSISTDGSVTFHIWLAEDVSAAVRELALAIGGIWSKNDPKANEFASTYYELTQPLGGLVLRILTERTSVCTRNQVGVERIEHEAQEAYVEERPVFEWDCDPLSSTAKVVRS